MIRRRLKPRHQSYSGTSIHYQASAACGLEQLQGLIAHPDLGIDGFHHG